MANFVLSLHASPSDSDACLSLLNFAKSTLTSGHKIDAIFLYQEAIWHASEHFVIAKDEVQLSEQWQDFVDEFNTPLLLCITAAEKRGLNIKSTGPFTVAGLAEFAMSVAKADKWLQFK
ncbi:sulfurtransferase complex subunit TusD [Pseudoalteromonas denitrificans]|uniref:tRNA 2-thiouridine synthesizing protein D n=1 Tax=Pseudoalteromonas denitrificans DSM 6059 TaxID=1123010 RepID=A0A1I1SJC7_9GAMM|nr:sulfurtransferase complex subunit TusD [Pseudoalteromonas denitrificans]SFD46574.1 tRNA 2-thiouridine synthesizing protein D [Pseudoalteromonas denitrificans DSM 6059]